MSLKDTWKKFRQAIHSDEFYDTIKHLLTKRPFLEGMPFWVAGVIVAGVAILYSASFTRAIQIYWSFSSIDKYFPYFASPFCLVLATWVVQKFAPEAGGTGIPNVLNAIRR